MKHNLKAVLSVASVIAFVLPASAQQENEENQASAQTGETSQCMEQLQQLVQSMQEDGYWLSGYRGYGTAGVMSPSAARSTAPVDAQPEQMTGELEVQPEGQDTTQDVPGGAPWGGATWEQRPQFEIGVLYRAGYVLAQNGKEEACQTVADATQERYERYVSDLQELGVDPQEVTTWRQAAIADSQPVTEMEGSFRVEDVIGTDIRNAQDNNLGSIEDVMLDPQTGEIQYVVVGYGGFLGVDTDDVVVPWERLRVTPGMNAFVLPVDEAAMEQAPQLPDGGLVDQQQTGSINPEEVDSYWNQAEAE